MKQLRLSGEEVRATNPLGADFTVVAKGVYWESYVHTPTGAQLNIFMRPPPKRVAIFKGLKQIILRGIKDFPDAYRRIKAYDIEKELASIKISKTTLT